MVASDNNSPDLAAELQRAEERRRRLGIERPPGHGKRPWALCLSGGGIRSATFCLGALQGLAMSPSTAARPTVTPDDKGTHAATPLGLLAQFDALSTVSGGGYVGAFFSSLFVKGRLPDPAQEDSDEAAAQQAYRALQEEPPGRMHTATTYDPTHPGRAALAWLRDNGRYLAPSGAGDVVYAAAVGIRNWFAAHYVVATCTLLLLLLSLLARLTLAVVCGQAGEALLMPGSEGIWWSSSWYAVGAVLLLLAAPLGIGFWFTQPRGGEQVSNAPRPNSFAAVTALVMAAALLTLGSWPAASGGAGSVGSRVLQATGALTLLGVFYFSVLALWHRSTSITALRVVMTRKLSTSLSWAVALAALASAETLAQTAAVYLNRHDLLLPTLGSIVTALVWLTRFFAQRASEKNSSALLEKIPLDLLAGLVGIGLWLVTIAALDLLLLWIVANGNPASPARPFADAHASAALCRAVGAALIVLMVAAISGQFPGFLNLSTFQSLYSARLTRAYLGASNPKRFAEPSATRHSVAEPVEGDNLSVDALHASRCAPLHYVNVCVNQTVGPGEQLVQRDRKGKPLLVAPGGFYLDGKPYPFPNLASSSKGELDAPLTVGEWIGVSGAAFTTGLGRSTSLGTSLLLGFANVRLGRWWRSGADDKTRPRTGLLRSVFRTQSYLIDEIRALFRGTRLPYQYLSDGGHFENTACYEMLRPERKVGLMVVCDCGADPDYSFDDLANLMRLARIDHSVEVSVNREIAAHPLLGRHFGTPDSFMRQADGTLPAPTERCAILLDVRSPAPAGHADATLSLTGRIVLLKPALLASTSADVVNYHAQHPAFPQEPTSDQFFDEAQWESYRKLGLEMALRVFPQGNDAAYTQAFWGAVLVP